MEVPWFPSLLPSLLPSFFFPSPVMVAIRYITSAVSKACHL